MDYGHDQTDEPVRDCDCKRCAIAERDRLRAAIKSLPNLLARHGVVDPFAVDDPESYDGYETLKRIEWLRDNILDA